MYLILVRSAWWNLSNGTEKILARAKADLIISMLSPYKIMFVLPVVKACLSQDDIILWLFHAGLNQVSSFLLILNSSTIEMLL